MSIVAYRWRLAEEGKCKLAHFMGRAVAYMPFAFSHSNCCEALATTTQWMAFGIEWRCVKAHAGALAPISSYLGMQMLSRRVEISTAYRKLNEVRGNKHTLIAIPALS